MTFFSGFPFSFIFSALPDRKKLSAATSKLTTLSDGFYKSSACFQGWLLFLCFCGEFSKVVGDLCLHNSSCACVTPLLEECLFQERLIMTIVAWSLGAATDRVKQHLQGTRAIALQGLWRGISSVDLLRFSWLGQGQQISFKSHV